MTRSDQNRTLHARRIFLKRSSIGLGSAALASILPPSRLEASAGEAAGVARGVVHPLHVVPRAKRVIFLCMAGGPSHLEDAGL